MFKTFPSVAPCPISSPESFQPGQVNFKWVGLSNRPTGKNLLGMKNPQMYRYMICISIQNIYNYVYIPGKIYTCFHIHVSTYVYILYILYMFQAHLFSWRMQFSPFFLVQISGDRQGCTLIPTYPYGKSLYKSYIHPQESLDPRIDPPFAADVVSLLLQCRF